jgi:fructokinase
MVVFEPSISSADAALFRRALAAATIIKYSDDYSAKLHAQLDQDGRRPIQITTHGAGGLEMRRVGDRPQRLAAFPTIALDTAGAGDWTTAGLLHRFVGVREPTSQELSSALRFGQALAAVNCSVIGARGAMELRRTTVLRRARRVLDSGALTATPRVNYGEPPAAPGGACPSCLMPSAGPAG